MNENEEPVPPIESLDEDAEQLQSLMSNPELLRAYGYQLTPKGAMCVALMSELGCKPSEAERLAQKLEDSIFLTGYIYVHEDHLRVED